MTRHVSFRAWRAGELAAGLHLGTRAVAEGLRFGEPVGIRSYDDPHSASGPRRYAWSAWLSPVVTPGHPFTSLVPSWNALTHGDSWLELEARVSTGGRDWSRWFTLGRWADSDEEIRPTSVAGQAAPEATVATDELTARGGVRLTSYQLRVVLLRGADSTAVPSVGLLGVVAALAGERPAAPPVADPVRGLELPVPAYSQQTHRGEYPQWDSDGRSWCSPTTTTMLLGRWGLGPGEHELAWVDASVADRAVDHAARRVFDHGLHGAGNWSFNTAYAGRYAEAFVTRLRSLEEAELFLAAGIPLGASLSFRREELAGAGYDTSGHLLAVVGFDAAGDVICHDPASHQLPSNDEVRVVFDRLQFERAWLDSAGGLVYVVRPHDVPLPACPAAERNW